jgi:hypothetical protein
MAKHFFFVDDSGSKNWEIPWAQDFVDTAPSHTEQNLTFWRGNYFVLAGIHISSDTVAQINSKIDELKKNVFGTKYVEIKSEWFRNPEKRRKKYTDAFGVSEAQLLDFTEQWYRFFIENRETVQLQAFVLDKRFFKNKRDEATPLQRLTQVLFDRVELHPSEAIEIVFDQFEDQIFSEKRAHGDVLKISDKELDLGSFHPKYSHARPRFEKSINSNFLQLADTVAYNVFRQFVDHGDGWEDEGAQKLPMYPFFERILPNFYHKDGRIGGVGIVKVPDPHKRGWRQEDT